MCTCGCVWPRIAFESSSLLHHVGNLGGVGQCSQTRSKPMSIKPLIVDWKGLKRMGWPYCRAHTWRLMFDPDYADDAFPACRKLGKHVNSHPVWRVSDVIAYFEARGLKVTEAWNAP